MAATFLYWKSPADDQYYFRLREDGRILSLFFQLRLKNQESRLKDQVLLPGKHLNIEN